MCFPESNYCIFKIYILTVILELELWSSLVFNAEIKVTLKDDKMDKES